MKYLILLSDGMADLPIESLDGKTPMEAAHKPCMDKLASCGYAGMVRTVPDSLPAGSDTANMSVMGFDPELYYSGRSPIEAISMGIDLKKSDVSFRVNLVTLSDEEPYSKKSMLDYSSDEITSEEAALLIQSINEHFAKDGFHFFPGRSYRHCLVWEGAPIDGYLTPPHDILTRKISSHLPKSNEYKILKDIMEESYDILKNHPVNIDRVARGLNPANSIWIWGQGTKPNLPSIKDIYGLKGSVISAVDLVFGLGICAGMKPVNVIGATGTIDTNFEGKANAAILEFENGTEYIYLHVEAPDECGHRNELDNKILSIERIDELILKPMMEYLEENKIKSGEDYRVMVLPDHPTPVSLRTHTHDPVPFVIYSSDNKFKNPIPSFSEKECTKSGLFFEKAHLLFEHFIKG